MKIVKDKAAEEIKKRAEANIKETEKALDEELEHDEKVGDSEMEDDLYNVEE